MELRKIEYTTKSRINIKAIGSFSDHSLRKKFENVGKFKPLILRIRIDHQHKVHIEDFDTITLQNIRRVAGYEVSKELQKGKDAKRDLGVEDE